MNLTSNLVKKPLLYGDSDKLTGVYKTHDTAK